MRPHKICRKNNANIIWQIRRHKSLGGILIVPANRYTYTNLQRLYASAAIHFMPTTHTTIYHYHLIARLSTHFDKAETQKNVFLQSKNC